MKQPEDVSPYILIISLLLSLLSLVPLRAAVSVPTRVCARYLRSIKAFSRWLWRERRTPEDPLCSLSLYNEQTDRRHVRRELTPEEINYLLRFVEMRTMPNHCMPGPDRAMVYRVACGTGFRVKELQSLECGSFDLESDPPTVTVDASYSKRRRRDVQPIHPGLAQLLRPWLADRQIKERPFKRMPRSMARTFRDDLRAARAKWIEQAKTDAERQERERSDFLAYRDASGRVVDFHATRHTFISTIVSGGASVKTAQELARHSTPTLTIGRYAHTRLHDLTGALEALAGMSSADDTREQQNQVATGTDGKTAMPANRQQLPANRQQPGGLNGLDEAKLGECVSRCVAVSSVPDEKSEVVTLSVFGNKKATSGETWRKAEGTGLAKWVFVSRA